MIFYFVIIGITTSLAWLFSHLKGNQKKIIYFFLILFPSFIAGLRAVGTDFLMYKNHFSEIIDGSFNLVDSNSIIVQGFRIIGKLGGDAQLAIFIISIITIWLAFHIIYLCKQHINTTFAIFSYMTMFYIMSFNIFRQLLAAEVFLLATVHLFTYGNKKKFWFFLIIAVLIHSAVLPFLIIYPLKNIIKGRKNVKIRITIYCATAIFIAILPRMADIMRTLVQTRYFNHYAWFLTRFEYIPLGIGAVRYIFLAIVPIIIIIIGKENITADHVSICYTPFYGILGTILWFSSYVTTASLYRSSYMLLISLPILHGYLFKKYYKRKKVVIVAGVALVLMLLCWYDFIFLNSGAVNPYKFFWT